MNRKCIYVNSAVRSAGTDEDFTITKTVQEFSRPPQSVKLVGAAIPFTWQNITSNNNTFTITQFVGGPTVSDDFVISSGNYTPTTLATALQTLINASSILEQVYTVAYSSTTSTFAFSTAGPDSFRISFADDGAALALGFAAGSSNPVEPELAVSSTSAVQLLPDYEVFICSDLVKGSDNGIMLWDPLLTLDSDNQSQILARMPVTGCHDGVMHYKASSDSPSYGIAQSAFARSVVAGTPATIRFFLTLPSGNVINLGGYHWSMELLFEF